jgi:glycosyltransferase involved in cell wall biosynthesis
MCGPLTGFSGGDMHALRLVQHWNERTPRSALLVAPETVRDKLPPEVRRAMRSIRTPLDRCLAGLVSYTLVVALRTVGATVRAPRASVAVAGSHFFHDVIPVVVHQLRFRSRPVVYVYHLVSDMRRGRSFRSVLSRAGERFSVQLLRRAGALLFVDNEETRASLTRFGVAPELIASTENAYEPSVALPPRVTPERPAVLFAGRFTEEKGVWDMLELARQIPGAVVTMIGDGPLRAELLERIRDEGIQNLDAPGYVSEEEKWRILRTSSVFAAPSREEGWGIAVGEALTAGLPVVAYDLPAYAHLGDLPITVPRGDLRAFREAVATLLAQPERLAQERERVHEGATRFPTWQAILEREIERMTVGS